METKPHVETRENKNCKPNCAVEQSVSSIYKVALWKLVKDMSPEVIYSLVETLQLSKHDLSFW